MYTNCPCRLQVGHVAFQIDLTMGDVEPSIDHVIQNGQPHPPEYEYPPSNNSHVSINKTAPLPPLQIKPSPQRERPMSLRSNSQIQYEERRLGSSRSELARDFAVPKKLPMREVVESPSSSGSQDTAASQNRSLRLSNLTDFFSPEVFHIVLQNPTTAHRFLKFCQSRACGESMEFLQKVEKYNRLLDEVSRTLGDIHATYTAPDAPRQINISPHTAKAISADIKQVTKSILPSLETIFLDAQENVEKLLASDTYPRFVKHQITTEATMALADHREKFAGLGDCFCLTDPTIADNPIVYASDGFVSVTGYSRKDIIPRNCRFLQGERTDTLAVKRLRIAIDACEETVELLLNYRKNGDPFWNLLYVAPLLNERGEVSFFLGGQINCSTTIHSCTDVLRVLSVNDDELDRVEESEIKSPSLRSREKSDSKPKSTFFKSWRKYNATRLPGGSGHLRVREEAGMENELLNRVRRMSFKNQVEAFYTAYSKYLVLIYNPATLALQIQHYSPGVIDILCLNLPNGAIAPIYNKDIFKVLSEHSSSSSSSSSTARVFRDTVRSALRAGKAVSVETGLLTGFEERKGGGWFGGGEKEGLRRVEERYVTHWTPLKDEEGRVGWVVLTIAPKV